MKQGIKFLFVAVLLSIASLSALSNSSIPLFDQLLNEAGLEFNLPEDFSPIEIQKTDIFPYEFAVRDSSSQLEIRYAIRPISRMEIKYEDPHSSAPEPNHIFTMMFTSLIGQLSSGGNSPHREYQQEHALKQFNADWAGASVFDVERAYSDEYDQALLIAMHKNNLSDAYLVILFNDYPTVKPLLENAMKSLVFK